jgi:tRNA(adenine34) deaminase
MVEALKEAWKAYQKDEVPVGAVLVKQGKVISRGYNQVEMLQDATAKMPQPTPKCSASPPEKMP